MPSPGLSIPYALVIDIICFQVLPCFGDLRFNFTWSFPIFRSKLPPMQSGFLIRNRYLILYGTSLAGLLILLNWLKLRLVVLDHALEVYIGSIAVIFTGLGIWLALKLTRPRLRTIVVEKTVGSDRPFSQNTQEIERMNLSRRELEVLELMARGLSNREIGEQLFVSLSTVKTHCNNLFEKMDVKRRTQAIEKGRSLGIIPR